MGGIQTNYHGEVVTLKDGDPDAIVPGLMALGEAACVSVHGANRLGSNSLIDLVVFGRAAGLRVAEIVTAGAPHPDLPKSLDDSIMGHFDKMRHASGGTGTSVIRDKMQRIMQNNCAVFRTGEVLEEGPIWWRAWSWITLCARPWSPCMPPPTARKAGAAMPARIIPTGMTRNG
jgi:succinate dehydrogenase / fumarate reductase flavoprotein subunit